MNDFIREFYESDMCEASKYYKLSDEVKEAHKVREKLYENLTKKLDKDELDLFEKYIDESQIVKNEEMFHAYVSGMRDIVRFAVGVFTE